MSDQPFSVPAVSPADVAEDEWWFSRHPDRRYRLRQAKDVVWIIIRRRSGVLLRAALPKKLAGTIDASNDKFLRVAWFTAAWPDLSPAERGELIKEAEQIEKKGKR